MNNDALTPAPTPAVATEPSVRRPPSEVLSFLAVGGIGFVVEAVILTTLTQFAAWPAWQARIPSFLTAALITWVLNRRHTFPQRGLQRRSVEAAFYVAIQVSGAGINLAIFSACLVLLPQLARIPVIPLAIGAVGGVCCNFLLSSTLLYSRRRAAGPG